MTGQRREARPRLASDVAGDAIEGRESWDYEKYFDPGPFNANARSNPAAGPGWREKGEGLDGQVQIELCGELN
jgi:hypothetical protein